MLSPLDTTRSAGTARADRRWSARKSSRRWLLAWLLALVAAAALVFAAVYVAANRQLERAAARSAMLYGRMIEASVPGLERWMTGGSPPASAIDALRRLRKVGDIFRFKLYDQSGRAIIGSDEIDRPGGGENGSALGEHHDDEAEELERAVLGGRPFVQLHRHGDAPGLPEVYSEAYAPVQVNGKTVGVIEVYVDQTDPHAEASESMAKVGLAMCGAFGVLGALGVLQARSRLRAQREADDSIRYLARHDALSGALNRVTFNEALANAIGRRGATGDTFAVLCADLDRFKEVNDTYGHAAGDEVLRESTARMRALVRHGDQLARLGGDEFAILQSAVMKPDDVRALAQRIVDSFARPFEVGGRLIECGVSVGAALLDSGTTDIAELMHKADLALYRAKASGRNTFSFYDPTLDAQLRERRELVAELRSAIADEALVLHYQPQMAGDGQRLTGCEALLRWPHPRRGQVPPGEFIPLAEKNGLIEGLGTWALRTACREAARWPAALTVAVNLSPVQLRAGDLVAVVKQALADSGLPPHRLELEITESMLIAHTEEVVQTLRTLSRMGVRIAMDDFGTGYSSLSYLWRFPFDKLKIDKAFTHAMADDPKVELIVRSIVSLAHAMKISVNAEGVETERQFALLRRYGCDELRASSSAARSVTTSCCADWALPTRPRGPGQRTHRPWRCTTEPRLTGPGPAGRAVVAAPVLGGAGNPRRRAAVHGTPLPSFQEPHR